MALSVWMLGLAVFLSGAVAGTFGMLAIGIRRGDRACDLADEPVTRLDALSRNAVGVGVRPGCAAGINSTDGNGQ
jgi:hypothetical protein